MAKKNSWLTGSAIGNLNADHASSTMFSDFANRVHSTASDLWNTFKNNLSTKTPEDTIEQQVQDYADLLDKYGLGPNSSSSSSSSYSTGAMPQRIDIQPMIDAYTNAANAQKNTLQTTANQQRSDLLNSIKRFQEQTTRSQELQRDAFNASRADLEEAAFQADRANRISAAARGIGGSGLQQLAQLQTLMQQNNAISDLAGENTDVQMQLAENLANYEEDVNTSIQNLLANLSNSLSEIDASLGSEIANLRYNEDVRYETARQQAAEQAAASAQSARNSYNQALLDYELGLREQADNEEQFNDLVKNLQSDFSAQIADITDTDELEKMRTDYRNELYTLVQDNLIANSVYTSGLNYLNRAYRDRLAALEEDDDDDNNSNSYVQVLGPYNYRNPRTHLRK